MRTFLLWGLLPLALTFFAVGSRPARAQTPLTLDGPLTTRTVAGPEWAKSQPIYEVNLDKYGFARGAALREFETHLPVLKEMGVGILWFMPLHPRGQKKAFGSPYSVRDYTDINPDLGTKAEFRHLVQHAHALGLHVLMDWVGNHSSWDNTWIEAHPDWYRHNDKGDIEQASTWADVAQLEYGTAQKPNQPLWNAMRDAMIFWVRDYGVDGFRCDAAGPQFGIPFAFWAWLRPQLDAVRPVFMLAESDDPRLHPAFDMSYDWTVPRIFWDICAGRKPATALDDVLSKESHDFPAGAVRMRFLDNHDWHNNADWGWGNGPAVDASPGMPQVAPLMLLCAALPGKPLVYNGQEWGFAKVDPSAEALSRRRSPVWPFYKRLLTLFGSQPAVWEGRFAKLPTDHDDKVYAFVRQHGPNRVLVIVNLSDHPQTAALAGPSVAGRYRDWFADRAVSLSAAPSVPLAPWGYKVYVGQTK